MLHICNDRSEINDLNFTLNPVSQDPSTFFSFWISFSRTLTIQRTARKGKEHPYSSLSLPLANEHWDICLRLCMWNVYHIFSVAAHPIGCYSTRFIHLRELTCDWTLHWALLLYCYNFVVDVKCYELVTDKLRIWTCIDYNPSITNTPINQISK